MDSLIANPAALQEAYPLYDQKIGADVADTLMYELQERSGQKIRRKNKDGK